MILIFDTSKEEVYLALVCENEIFEEKFIGGRSLNSEIFDRLDSLFAKANAELNSVKGIVAGVGPGSFTGLRIGLSIVNTLGYSLDIPVFAITDSDSKKLFKKAKEVLQSNTSSHFSNSLCANYGAEPNITKPNPR